MRQERKERETRESVRWLEEPKEKGSLSPNVLDDGLKNRPKN